MANLDWRNVYREEKRRPGYVLENGKSFDKILGDVLHRRDAKPPQREKQKDCVSPFTPKHPCGYPGCATLTDTARCERHRKQEQREYDQSRKGDSFRKLYSSARWKRIRDWHLTHEPLCRACKERGRLEAARIVDHVTPMRRGGDPFDDSNFQSLCRSCHSGKSK